MKTKKVVVGAIAATMLSLSVCSLAPVAAAGETVQISVGTANVKAGETFTVDVSLADIPSTGIQALDFAVSFDNSIITINSVEPGALISKGTDSADQTGSLAPLFEPDIKQAEGAIDLIWSTATDNASYWLNGSGVFCTITGTVSASAQNGTETPLKITPVKRETFAGSGSENASIGCGYQKEDETVIKYDVKLNDGSVKIGAEDPTTAPSTGTPGVTMRGDANCDNIVDIADAVLIMQKIANPDNYGLGGASPLAITPQGEANGDVISPTGNGGDGITNADALQIQNYLIGIVAEL